LDKDHEDDGPHQKMDQKTHVSLSLLRKHPEEEVEPEMPPLLQTEGSPEDREPNKEVTGEFFGPVKGLGQDVTIENLEENDHGHDCNECDQGSSLCLGQDMIEPYQGMYEWIHIF
jgi:hypothetical protein